MRTLFKKPVVIIWIILLLFSLVLLATKGLHYGVDFSGGTSFQIELEKPATTEELSGIASIINKRLDWSGSKDAKVTPSGNQYLIAQLAESDPKEISKLKSVLLKQGKFEAVLDGNVLFSGDDIKSISKDLSHGYGVRLRDKYNKIYGWELPFLLSPQAADKFARDVFHRCTPTVTDSGETDYDCEKTYFFIDRPSDSIIILDKTLYNSEKQIPVSPESASSSYMSIDDVLAQLNVPYYIVDDNFTDEQLNSIKQDINAYSKAIISDTVPLNIKNTLEKIGYKVIIKQKPDNQPWIWEATGLKSVIAITPNIANMDVPTIDSPRFKTFSQLAISGSAEGMNNAKKRLDSLLVILESGSLPVPIEGISTESISPYLGSEFLNNALWIAIFALITVAIVLFFRYKVISLSLPILLVGSSEIIILLGVLSLISFRLDLAAVAGVLANIGTGVDDQIIITDELIKKKHETYQDSEESLKTKIKKAFFIVFASASTTMSTMIPIIFFSLGLSKLVGFAVTIILGSLIGIFITRPVFAEISKRVFASIKKRKVSEK